MSNALELHAALREAIVTRTPVASCTIVRGEPLGAKLLVMADTTLGSLGDSGLDTAVAVDARSLTDAEKSETRAYGDLEVFIETFPTPPTLLIVGAVHVAQALCEFGKGLGFDVIVVDARPKLATAERFPRADRIIQAWPDEAMAELDVRPNWYIAILTHDPKFDEPAILSSLQTPSRYIGAIGSRKTTIDRRRRLAEAGVSDEDMTRVRGPIGLDIGAATPEEMAISILGEIIASRHGRNGGALTAAAGNIRGESAS